MPTTRVADLDVVWDVAGPEHGAPVLMINGFGSARAGWSVQAAALAERYRVYTYDNRDVGETGAGDDPRPYGIARFAQDAAGLVGALGIGPVHVIGASMGGTIAQELALGWPELMRSAQIVCSWPRTDPWLAELHTQWKAIFREMGPLAWARNSWIWVFTHRWYRDPAHLETLLRDAATYAHPQTAEMFERQIDAAMDWNALDRLGAIAVPIHVIAGAEDIYTPPRYSAEIAAAIPGSRLTVLPDVGHGMFWETPDAFNAALLDFLDEQDSRDAATPARADIGGRGQLKP
jgi:pimeloyl-ACP methyl ester carboxylesterase